MVRFKLIKNEINRGLSPIITTGKVTSTAISGVATPLAQDKLDKMSNKP